MKMNFIDKNMFIKFWKRFSDSKNLSQYLTRSALVLLFFAATNISIAESNNQTKSSTTQKKTSQSRKEALDEAKAIWNKIKDSFPKDEKLRKEGGAEYWSAALTISFDAFGKLMEGPHFKEKIEYYMNQFGKHGPQVDLLWLILLRTYLLLPDHENPNLHRLNGRPLRREAQIVVAKVQVYQFLEDPKLLSRYYQATVWYDRFFEEKAFPSIFSGVIYRINKTDKPAYWWFARNYILIAHATGRDDLLKDVKPKELHKSFRKWHAWIIREGIFLRASKTAFIWEIDEEAKKKLKPNIEFLKFKLPKLKVKPKYPFPNWKGPKPGTPAEHKAME